MSNLLLLSTPLAGDALPGGVCPSLSNITLGSYLREQGADVSILDPSVDLDSKGDNTNSTKELLERTADKVLAESPKIVGIACLSPIEGRFGAAMAKMLKSRAPNLPVVLGGIWVTACGEEILHRCPEVDGIIVGPGEQAALVLAQDGLSQPASVPGLIWRDKNGIQKNPPAEKQPIAPSVDLSLLHHPERYDIFCWLTSRGCPYHCAFCTERLSSPGFVHDSLEKVAADIKSFTSVGKSWYLWICDPLFGVSRSRLAKICGMLEKTPLRFLAESRVDVLHPDDVPLLGAAGCDFIYFGLEAVGQRSLRELDKIDTHPARHKKYLDGTRALVEACLQSDILPVFGILQPVPGDTPDDLAEALSFLEEIAKIPDKLGDAANGLGPYFHAFPLRFDRGAPYEVKPEHLTECGVTFTATSDPLFQDCYLSAASPSVDAATAAKFRESVQALNPKSDHVRQRLFRSFPRPYVEFNA